MMERYTCKSKLKLYIYYTARENFFSKTKLRNDFLNSTNAHIYAV